MFKSEYELVEFASGTGEPYYKIREKRLFWFNRWVQISGYSGEQDAEFTTRERAKEHLSVKLTQKLGKTRKEVAVTKLKISVLEVHGKDAIEVSVK